LTSKPANLIKIIFIHSLNDYKGSPNVLSVIIRGMVQKGYEAELITSRGEGFLSDIRGVNYRYTCYRWSNHPLRTFASLIFSQTGLFFRVLFYSGRHFYYINTIVPFGAILACWLTGKRYVIHVHENMQQDKPIYRIFRAVYRLCNKQSIFVSEYVQATALNCRDGMVIYNALPDEFYNTADEYLNWKTEQGKTILMVASLRRFKGIYEFAALAKQLPQYLFELVLASGEKETELFRKEVGDLPNLQIYARQTNLHPFYQRARLLLQLSHPETWVETFGLTILEAMAYGIPAIVPYIGGPAELIVNGVNGYTVNPHNLQEIGSKIDELINIEFRYRKFSKAARTRAKQFQKTDMIHKIEHYCF
jgi:L-malate glycosyltransferase